MNILPNPFETLFPLSNFKTLEDYFKYFIYEKNINDLDVPLYESKDRKKWLLYYPDLLCFPQTLKYIQNENSVLSDIVAKELENVQLYLSPGQVLFHSGVLPDNVPLKKGIEFKLKDIFSTTLDPYIANCHDGNDDIYWYIIIKNNIRCLPVPDEHGEYEVIILDSPKAKIIDFICKVREPFWNDFESNLPEMKTIIYIELG